MKRRTFIAGVASAATLPLAARAQQATPLVGSIFSVSAASWTDNMDGFRRGLAEVGFADGRNVTIDYRWADGSIERMRESAADLIRRKVAVILAGGSNTGVRDVVAATKTIPIVLQAPSTLSRQGWLRVSIGPAGMRPGSHSSAVSLSENNLSFCASSCPMPPGWPRWQTRTTRSWHRM